MSTSKPHCTLCDQTVLLNHFTIDLPEGKLAFCCLGCLSIYQMLYSEPTTIINYPEEKFQ